MNVSVSGYLYFGWSMHSSDWNQKSKADAIAEFTGE